MPFTEAIQAAYNAGGGIVLVPAGKYLIESTLNVPSGVSIQGSFDTVPSHDIKSDPTVNNIRGTVLLTTAHKGLAIGTPFITLHSDTTLHGLVIFYPEQDANPPGNPTPYPWCVALVENNAAITDVEILNAYQAIYAVNAHRHYIARVQGQPIFRGLFIDETYDIGRVEDVHFNPWWSNNINILNFQMTQGIAFTIGRSDWEYVFNTFSFGYSIGYYFIQSQFGGVNGNFLGIGADLNTKASVYVEGAQPYGILITNGEFTAFVDKNFCSICDDYKPVQVIVGEKNTGSVRFVNSAFWGPAYQIAQLSGTEESSLGFSDCIFSAWDVKQEGVYAITSKGGNLLLYNNEFKQNSPQVQILKGTNKAIVTGNLMRGKVQIQNDLSASKSVVENNI